MSREKEEVASRNNAAGQKPRSGVFILLAVAALLAVAVVSMRYTVPRSGGSSADAKPGESVNDQPSAESAPRINSSRDGAAARTNVLPARAVTSEATTTTSGLSSSNNAMMVPTTQPTFSGTAKTWRLEFVNRMPDPSLFARSENIEFTAEGMKLKADPDGKFATEGIIQSQPVPTDYPINAVGALWKAQAGEGTGVKVEIATSSDGEQWSEWSEVHTDPHSDPQPTYGDGTPNPNFGYQIGTLTFRTDNRATFVRYRMNLTTNNPGSSPVVEAVALTYMDSTDANSTTKPEPEPQPR